MYGTTLGIRCWDFGADVGDHASEVDESSSNPGVLSPCPKGPCSYIVYT